MCSYYKKIGLGVLAVFLLAVLAVCLVQTGLDVNGVAKTSVASLSAAGDLAFSAVPIVVKPEPSADLSDRLVPVVEDSRLTFTDGKESVAVNFVPRDLKDGEIDFREVAEFVTVSEKVEGGYKWSYSFILPREDFKASVNILADKSVRLLNDKFLVLDEDKFVSFEDVLAAGFTYEIKLLDEREAQVIFFKDWETAGVKAGETVLIDPYVVSYPFHDGYLERRVTGVFDVFLTSTTLDVGNNIGAGDADYQYRAYLKFNTSMIDLWDTIVNATFYGRVAGKTCSSGSSRFWLQNISDYGDLGESDWGMSYQNISIFFYANENASGWYTVNVTDWIAKAANTFFRIQGSYEDYNGVDCFISVSSNESTFEPYVEIYYTDVSPNAPNIIISSPANGSSVPTKIYLNVSSYGGTGPIDKWWYKLDNGSNATFVPNATFFTPLGAHCITVYLNNTYGSQSSNTTCFTVTSYETALNCWVVPDVLPVGQPLVDYCNYTYARNGSAVDNASCRINLVDPIVIRRFYAIDSEEQLFNSSLAGFAVELSTDMHDVGGGAYLRCTNQTSGNFSIWAFVASANPFTSLDDFWNITSLNYTSFIGSFSCDSLNSLFGVKGSVLMPISLYANETWLQQSLVSLGSPLMAYYGFYGGCLNCSGGNDSWYIGVNTHNNGFTFHGNLSQQNDWELEGVEHAHWLFASVTRVPMTFNASSGLYVQIHNVSMWAEQKQYAAFGSCSKSAMENKTSYFTYNLTGVGLPVCSIDSFSAIVALAQNQTFTWSGSSQTPFLERYAELRNSTGDTLLSSGVVGMYSLQLNDTGDYSITCFVRNLVGDFNSTVSFTVAAVAYSLELYYSPYAVAGNPTKISAFIMLNGTSVHVLPNLTIGIDGSVGDMVWVPADSAYEVVWIPSVNGDYLFNVSGDLPPVLVADGLIKVRTPFNVTVRIWNNINMTPESRYHDEFAWIYVTKELDPTLVQLFGRDRFSCPPQGSDECFWHGKYDNGTAVITVYEAGNYSMYIRGNNIRFQQSDPSGAVVDCEFCPPWIIQSRYMLNLGDYYLDSPELIDLYYSDAELYYMGALFGVFSSWLTMALFAVLAIVFFFVVLVATGSLKAAIAGMVVLPTIIYLALHLILW